MFTINEKLLFQISVTCDTGDVLRASCAKCPNPLKPDFFGKRVCDDGVVNVNNVDGGICDFAWCTGGGDCKIRRLAPEGQDITGNVVLEDTCISEYFERYLSTLNSLISKHACLACLETFSIILSM